MIAGIKGAVIGGATAGLTHGVGSLAGSTAFGTAKATISSTAGKLAGYGVKIVGHGIVQGGKAAVTGGKFAHGFISGAVSGGGEYLMGGNKLMNVFIGAGIGGTASELGGGKFSNGAISGAMVALYNKTAHRKNDIEQSANEGVNMGKLGELAEAGFDDLSQFVDKTGKGTLKVLGRSIKYLAKGTEGFSALAGEISKDLIIWASGAGPMLELTIEALTPTQLGDPNQLYGPFPDYRRDGRIDQGQPVLH